MASDCTILVASCDAYLDILSPFFKLLKKNWPELKYDIVLSTETSDFRFKGLDIVNIHPSRLESTWTERIYEALSKIKSKQIFLLCDDFFVYDKVNNDKIEEIVGWLKSDSRIASFTLWPSAQGGCRSRYNGFSLQPRDAKYKIAIIAGLWNKKWLQKYLKNTKENAWQFEPNANKRSHKMFFPGRFYAMLDKQDSIFPYDFSKVGLFSGEWLPDTRRIFKENNIKIDFAKRGVFDNVYRSLSQSTQNAFVVDSKILPNRYYEKPIKFILNSQADSVRNGKIHQEYRVKYGRDCFRWDISDVTGYSLSNLKIIVEYKNHVIKEVGYDYIVGSFYKIKDRYIFNSYAPYMIIPTEQGELFKKITIDGEITMPAAKNDLKRGYQKNTVELPDNPFARAIYRNRLEYMLSSDYSGQAVMEPQIVFQRVREKTSVFTESVMPGGAFSYSYAIPPGTNSILWTPSLDTYKNGFCIFNLNIVLSVHSGPDKVLGGREIAGFTPCVGDSNVLCCLLKQTLMIDPEEYDTIRISGKMVKPIPIRLLRSGR